MYEYYDMILMEACGMCMCMCIVTLSFVSAETDFQQKTITGCTKLYD